MPRLMHKLRKIVLYRFTEWHEEKTSGGSVWSGKKMSSSVRIGQKNIRFGVEWVKQR